MVISEWCVCSAAHIPLVDSLRNTDGTDRATGRVNVRRMERVLNQGTGASVDI